MSQTPCPPVLNLTHDDLKKLLACNVHLGHTNLSSGMQRYVHSRNDAGNHIIDLRKTWEKLVLAARVITAVDVPSDVCVIGLNQGNAEPIAQRAVMKFGKYTGAKAIAGTFTPGSFTNQIQSAFREPNVIILSDPIKDHQPLMESSYMNIPVIALVNTHHNLRNIDIAIPCNTESAHSVALIYWLLAREVQRLQGTISRDRDWDVMVDMFIYKSQEEQEKQEKENKSSYATGPWSGVEGGSTWDETGASGAAAEEHYDVQEQWGSGNWESSADVVTTGADPTENFHEGSADQW